MFCLKMKSRVCLLNCIDLCFYTLLLLAYNIHSCDPAENEKDDSPPAEELKATAKKENQPVLEPTKGDTQVNKAFNRLVRGMPKSRRSGILACLTSQHGSFRKRSLNLGESSGSKRTKVHGVHDESQQRSRTMSQSLSPRSIRRGLFIEGPNMN